MNETISLLNEILIDLRKQRQYHEDKLTDINQKITSHESVIKMIEDDTNK